MSVALKAVAWAWRFTQTVKRLPGTLDTGELQFPGVQRIPGSRDSPVSKVPGAVLLFVWQKFRADLNFWAINLKFLQILENYMTYNL